MVVSGFPSTNFAAFKPILVDMGTLNGVCDDDEDECEQQDVLLNDTYIILLGVANIFALMFGWLFDKIGRKKLCFIGFATIPSWIL